jgi:hypothetical protein
VYGITVTPLSRQRDIPINISQKLRTNGAAALHALRRTIFLSVFKKANRRACWKAWRRPNLIVL